MSLANSKTYVKFFTSITRRYRKKMCMTVIIDCILIKNFKLIDY